MTTASQYDAMAIDRVREIVATEHTVLRRELESRISEGYFASSRENIDPHHVSNAIRFLVDRGELKWDTTAARGGAQITTLQPTDRTGRGDRIDRAAARKRLLWARYLGWATGTKRHPHGLIGPAGEAATRTGILQSGVVLPAAPDANAVSQILGVNLSGPLDSAGITVPLTSQGIPGTPVTLLFEVKNVRQWLYPSAAEPYQLLGKAAHVQQARPDAEIVPVLVCRKAQATLFWMASQLGFLIIDMERQFIGAVEEDKYLEVRNELGFNDLVLGQGPSLRVRDRLRNTIRDRTPRFATAWKRTALDDFLGPTLTELSVTRDQRDRTHLVQTMSAHVADRGWGLGWAGTT